MTSSYFNGGDLGGIAGADAKCQSYAATKGFKGTYRAWLGAGATYSPALSWRREVVPYVNVAGVVVANGWSQLVSGTLAHAVALDESGKAAQYAFWTGTTPEGYPSGADCAGWTSTAYGYASNGSPGSVSYISNGATTSQNGGMSCMTGYGFGALLCVEQ